MPSEEALFGIMNWAKNWRGHRGELLLFYIMLWVEFGFESHVFHLLLEQIREPVNSLYIEIFIGTKS